MVSRQDREKFRKELVEVLGKAGDNKELLQEFLKDLFTPVEFDEIAARWQIVKLLKQEVPQHEIAKRTHTGVATVTRGAREMRNHSGGFWLMLSKLGI